MCIDCNITQFVGRQKLNQVIKEAQIQMLNQKVHKLTFGWQRGALN